MKNNYQTDKYQADNYQTDKYQAEVDNFIAENIMKRADVIENEAFDLISKGYYDKAFDLIKESTSLRQVARDNCLHSKVMYSKHIDRIVCRCILCGKPLP